MPESTEANNNPKSQRDDVICWMFRYDATEKSLDGLCLLMHRPVERSNLVRAPTRYTKTRV